MAEKIQPELVKDDEHKTAHIILKIISAVGLIGSIILSVYGWKTGILTSKEAMENYIRGFGTKGIIIFIAFQAVQVIIPILPGSLGCLVGVLLFGAWWGFLYNYVGICAGSVMAFLIAKYFGKPILPVFFSKETIQKYEGWTSKNFTKWFAIAIFAPLAPDDFLCFLAGTTEMSLKVFTIIILLGKPLAIALYSLGLMKVFDQILLWIRH